MAHQHLDLADGAVTVDVEGDLITIFNHSPAPVELALLCRVGLVDTLAPDTFVTYRARDASRIPEYIVDIAAMVRIPPVRIPSR